MDCFLIVYDSSIGENGYFYRNIIENENTLSDILDNLNFRNKKIISEINFFNPIHFQYTNTEMEKDYIGIKKDNKGKIEWDDFFLNKIFIPTYNELNKLYEINKKKNNLIDFYKNAFSSEHCYPYQRRVLNDYGLFEIDTELNFVNCFRDDKEFKIVVLSLFKKFKDKEGLTLDKIPKKIYEKFCEDIILASSYKDISTGYSGYKLWNIDEEKNIMFLIYYEKKIENNMNENSFSSKVNFKTKIFINKNQEIQFKNKINEIINEYLNDTKNIYKSDQKFFQKSEKDINYKYQEALNIQKQRAIEINKTAKTIKINNCYKELEKIINDEFNLIIKIKDEFFKNQNYLQDLEKFIENINNKCINGFKHEIEEAKKKLNLDFSQKILEIEKLIKIKKEEFLSLNNKHQ